MDPSYYLTYLGLTCARPGKQFLFDLARKMLNAARVKVSDGS